jgi:hypothetical protein
MPDPRVSPVQRDRGPRPRGGAHYPLVAHAARPFDDLLAEVDGGQQTTAPVVRAADTSRASRRCFGAYSVRRFLCCRRMCRRVCGCVHPYYVCTRPARTQRPRPRVVATPKVAADSPTDTVFDAAPDRASATWVVKVINETTVCGKLIKRFPVNGPGSFRARSAALER